MAGRKPVQKSAKSGFTDDERAAMKERAQELKAASRGKKGAGEADALAKIALMPAPERALAERLHALIKAAAPGLTAKTWYGMPAYARGGDVVCFFQSGSKFKTRYSTLGFSDKAQLDDGSMWPTAFALKQLGAAEEAAIRALVKKAAG